MSDEHSFRTRRTVLQSVSVAIAGGFLAGCLDDSVSADDDDNDPTNDGTLASDDNDTDASDGSAADDAGDTIQETETETEIAPGTQIVFRGQTAYWDGLVPSPIAGELNPTLILEVGETYTIGWSEGDGNFHNIEIRNDNDDVVDGLQTEVVADPDEDQFLEFVAACFVSLVVSPLASRRPYGRLCIYAELSKYSHMWI